MRRVKRLVGYHETLVVGGGANLDSCGASNEVHRTRDGKQS